MKLLVNIWVKFMTVQYTHC